MTSRTQWQSPWEVINRTEFDACTPSNFERDKTHRKVERIAFCNTDHVSVNLSIPGVGQTRGKLGPARAFCAARQHV